MSVRAMFVDLLEAGAVRHERDELPLGLRTFDNVPVRERFTNVSSRDRLKVAFPANESEIELTTSLEGRSLPVVVKLQGGVPPFRLIEEEKPAAASRRREFFWEPRGRGFFRLSVLDAIGQVQTVNIRIN